MSRPLLLTDAEVNRFPPAQAVEVMREALLAHASGQLHAPARLHAADLTFTVGGTPEVFGFRAYATRNTPADEQLVALWDAEGRVQGLIVGGALGPLRTAALGAVATDVLSAPGASRLGLIGSGMQARAHALAVATVRPLTQVLVYSRRPNGREALAAELRASGLNAEAVGRAEEVCERSDLLTLATSSAEPVIEAAWVRPGTHVCTLGPKERQRHEFPPDLAQRAARVVTDSPAQLGAYPGGHVLAGTEVQSLGACLASPPARQDADITLFLSVGLAGTEVLLACALLDDESRDAC